MSPTGSFSPATRFVLGGIIIILALLLLAGGWTIPFQFESFSILYKFGAEKTMLRSGKMIGITGVVFVFFQLVLASRFTFMERIFSLRRLLFLHRINGMAIGMLAVLHPLLIKGSEQFTSYTLEKKYYPEFLGFAVAAVLLILILTAILRNFFRLSYQGWLLQHRISSTLLLVLMPAHVLLVSETFKSGPPRSAALVIFSFNLLLLARIWLQRIHRQSALPGGQSPPASGTGPGTAPRRANLAEVPYVKFLTGAALYRRPYQLYFPHKGVGKN